MSRDSVVTITTGSELEERGVGVRVPIGSKIYLLHVAQTGCGVHLTFYPKGTGGSGVKSPGREPDLSPPTSADVKKM
jgi:hypothetical protein